MKSTMKLWMTAAILLLCGLQTNAQNQVDYATKHEIAIAYGAGSTSSIINAFEDITVTTSLAGKAKFDNEKNFGAITAEYFYTLNTGVRIGGILGYANQKKDILVDSKNEGDAKLNYITVMPAVKLDWLRRSNFGLYSKFAAGVTYRTEKLSYNDGDSDSENKLFFNFQASVLGLEAGSNQVRGFAELGFGEQGIILVGVRYKF